MVRISIRSRLAPFSRAGVHFADVRNPVVFDPEELGDVQFLKVAADPALTITITGLGDGDAAWEMPGDLREAARHLLLAAEMPERSPLDALIRRAEDEIYLTNLNTPSEAQDGAAGDPAGGPPSSEHASPAGQPEASASTASGEPQPAAAPSAPVDPAAPPVPPVVADPAKPPTAAQLKAQAKAQAKAAAQSAS